MMIDYKALYEAESKRSDQLLMARDAERERADALAAHVEQLREALSGVHKLICEGATSGFNPLEGGWAENLFLSNAKTNAVLKAMPKTSLVQRDARVAEWVMKSVASGKAPAQVIADIAAGGGS